MSRSHKMQHIGFRFSVVADFGKASDPVPPAETLHRDVYVRRSREVAQRLHGVPTSRATADADAMRSDARAAGRGFRGGLIRR